MSRPHWIPSPEEIAAYSRRNGFVIPPDRTQVAPTPTDPIERGRQALERHRANRARLAIKQAQAKAQRRITHG
jgi:hypothetical protein